MSEENQLYQKIGELTAEVRLLSKALDDNNRLNSSKINKLETEIQNLEKALGSMTLTWNKIGGGMLAVLMIGSFIGWFLSNAAKFKELLP